MSQAPFAGLKSLLLDMDGVLWRDSTPLLDLPAAFEQIQSLGLTVLLATNNSMLSRQDYVEKFRRFGVVLSEDQIYNSAFATAAYLKQRLPAGSPVFVIGEAGLSDSLHHAGFHITPAGALAVVVGIDRQINYQKITIAMRLIREGALFIGTNADKTFPTPDGVAPGAGSILAAVETASEKEPIIIGKPFPILYEMALKDHHLTPQETLMVGDRLDTDILGGQRAGCKTALVLSGVTTEAEAKRWQPQPDVITDNFRQLLQELAAWKKGNRNE